MSGENINDFTYNYILEKIKTDNTIVAINAGTPGVFGINAERRKTLGKHFVDVGIAEEHAVAYASALAKGGAKPIFMVMSSFIQRTYDKLSQDLALNNNPAVILVAWGGISGADMTHLCTFDISMASNIPNLIYLAPTTVEEYMAMLDWAVEQNEHPVIIRQPKEMIHTSLPVDTDYSKLNTYKIEEQGNKVAIIAEGSFFKLGKKVAEELNKHNIKSTLINPRYLTGIDKGCLENLKNNHQVVITLENGELDGGFGEKITRFYGSSEMKVLNYGSFKEFTDRANLDELYTRYRLKPELIVKDILDIL
jgi:1-deoxy-D-xylulose-5-phosphate synthase